MIKSRKRKFAILMIFNIIVVLILGWLFFGLGINIRYMELKEYPDPVYITNGLDPYLFKIQNGSLIFVFSEFIRMPEQEIWGREIFLISSENGHDWNKIIQITNDTNHNKFPKLIQQNESTFRLYYLSTTILRTWNWQYIESKDLINWTDPKFCERPPSNNQYWSEINNPPYFKDAKEYPDDYSLIKNHKGRYIFVGDHDISTSIDYIKSKLFITISDNGKDWHLPIVLSEKDISWQTPSLIEITNGTYALAYHYTENHYRGNIAIIIFSDSDLENISGPITIIYNQCIMCFILWLILLVIFDSIVIRSFYVKKYVWRSYVPVSALTTSILVPVTLFLNCVIIISYAQFQSIMLTIILVAILILLLFILGISNIRRIGSFFNSYRIVLDLDKPSTKKIIASIKKYLKINRIDYKYRSKNFQDGTFHKSFKRKAESLSFIEIWGNLDGEVIIFVFSSFLKDIRHVMPILNLIWHEIIIHIRPKG